MTGVEEKCVFVCGNNRVGKPDSWCTCVDRIWHGAAARQGQEAANVMWRASCFPSSAALRSALSLSGEAFLFTGTLLKKAGSTGRLKQTHPFIVCYCQLVSGWNASWWIHETCSWSSMKTESSPSFCSDICNDILSAHRSHKEVRAIGLLKMLRYRQNGSSSSLTASVVRITWWRLCPREVQRVLLWFKSILLALLKITNQHCTFTVA